MKGLKGMLTLTSLTLALFAGFQTGSGAQGSGAPGSNPPQATAPKLPADVHPESLSRLPLIKREEMDDAGKKVYDTVVSPQTRTLAGLRGPYGIWLYSPKLAEHLLAANQYVRYGTNLDRRLTELAILVTAREMDNQFEWSTHETEALKVGLEPKIIDLVKRRQDAAGLGEKETVIIQFGREVFRQKKVRSATYAHALKLFGKQGVVDLAGLMGSYAMIATTLNAFDQQLRPEQPPLLPIP